MRLWGSEISASTLAHKIRKRVVPNLRYLRHSRLRLCRSCDQRSLIVALGPNDEFELCIRCRANLRYELLAVCIRRLYPNIHEVDALELDFASPLRRILDQAKTYTRSFYRADIAPGTVRHDGAVCQDVTRLTFADDSLDLIVSSDVLEHVPDAAAAFRETARVLRPAGMHIFTVPPRAATIRRASIVDGSAVFHMPPEFHFDPLDEQGILSYWDYGPDIQSVFPVGLTFRVVAGPEGPSNRIVWTATKN